MRRPRRLPLAGTTLMAVPCLLLALGSAQGLHLAVAGASTLAAIDSVKIDADPATAGIQPCRSLSVSTPFSIDLIVDINAADSDNFASGGNVGFNFATGPFTSPAIDFAPGALDDVPGFTPIPQGESTTRVPGRTYVARAYFNPGASAPGLAGQVIAARATLTAGAEAGLQTISVTKSVPLDGSFDFFLGSSPAVQPTNVQSATIAVGVDCPLNNPPEASSQSVPAVLATRQTIILAATDANGDCPQTFAIVTGPSNGSLGDITDVTCSGGKATATVSYTPRQGFVGSDSFTFKASDAVGESSIATVGLDVAAAPTVTPGTPPAANATPSPTGTAAPAAGADGEGGGRDWTLAWAVGVPIGAILALLAAAIAWRRMRGRVL